MNLLKFISGDAVTFKIYGFSLIWRFKMNHLMEKFESTKSLHGSSSLRA